MTEFNFAESSSISQHILIDQKRKKKKSKHNAAQSVG
jgi:hypothetical protein